MAGTKSGFRTGRLAGHVNARCIIFQHHLCKRDINPLIYPNIYLLYFSKLLYRFQSIRYYPIYEVFSTVENHMPEINTKAVHQDELAHDTKRLSLLDVMDRLQAGKSNVSRILFVHQLGEGAKPSEIEEDFRTKVTDFNSNGQNAATTSLLAEVTDFELSEIQISGLLYVVGSFFVHFLEGPTDSLLYLLKNTHKAVVNAKVHYLVERRGVRATRDWNVFHGTSKFGTAAKIGEGVQNETVEIIFQVYKKFLTLHTIGGAGETHDNDFYKRNTDALPAAEDIQKLHDPIMNPDSFDLDAFVEFFGRCGFGSGNEDFTSQSELLWPIPPPLKYYDESHVGQGEGAA